MTEVNRIFVLFITSYKVFKLGSYLTKYLINLSIVIFKMRVRLLVFVLLLALLYVAISTSFLDNSEGLCGNVPATCSASVQKYGICCAQPGARAPALHNNWCVACKSVSIVLCRAASASPTPTATGDASDHVLKAAFLFDNSNISETYDSEDRGGGNCRLSVSNWQ